MKKVKYYLNIFCIAFTINILLLLLVEKIFDFDSLSSLYILQLLIMQVAIATTLFLLDLINFKTEILYITSTAIAIYLVVCVFGLFVFKFLNFNAIDLLITAIMTLIIYFVVYFILHMVNKADEKAINKILKEKNNEQNY